MKVHMNEQINAPEVRVIGPEGRQHGIMPIAQALEMARGLHMDLVEIAPNAIPPVARIVDMEKLRREKMPPPDHTNN
jgi:translation initiation factor IF-3